MRILLNSLEREVRSEGPEDRSMTYVSEYGKLQASDTKETLVQISPQSADCTLEPQARRDRIDASVRSGTNAYLVGHRQSPQ
jgi:hypothetical protein